MKAAYLIILSLLLVECGCAQQRKNFDKIHWQPENIYLVTRGTSSKSALIAERFNLDDKCSTHVGIGLVIHGNFRIFHVTNTENDSPSALVNESIGHFTNLPDALYCSIWEYNASAAAVQRLQDILQLYLEKRMTFDFNFDAEDDQSMYCSEFCAKVLLQTGIFDFPLVEAPLDYLCRAALGRETLYYWPVDFFQKESGFHKIYETWLYGFDGN